MSEAGPVLYDTVELRRRIAGAFSAGELRTLAESMGVGGINWDRGIQEAAREVVRQCERYAGLPALIARLREERPLVEWPEPAAAAPPETPGAAAPAPLPDVSAPAAALPPTRAYPALPTLSSTPGSFGPQPPAGTLTTPAAPLPDPYAPPPGPPAVQPPVAAVPPPAERPRAAPPRTAGWPGVVGEPAAPATRPGGIDPRIFVAVAGLMVVAAVIAYLAGRASSATAGTEAAPEGSPSASASAAVRAARSDGPAAHAADALARSFANLARVCELPSSAGTGVYVFRRVFERCGPPPQQQRRPRTPLPEASAEPAPAPSADPGPAQPAPPRNKRPRGDAPPGDAPAPAKGGCMGTCDATHGACRGHCGAEPTESSAYDSYQRCLGQCLREASRCRLGCR